MGDVQQMGRISRRRPRLPVIVARVIYAGLAVAAVWLAVVELRASPLQALVFSRLADDLIFWVERGPSPGARYPEQGPYNERLGYTRVPAMLSSVAAHNYTVVEQARQSASLQKFMDLGGFATYHEKDQAGLTLLDQHKRPVWVARHPERVYPNFESIPKLVVETLLFIENRELLEQTYPARNPAIEWNRLGAAVASGLYQVVDPDVRRHGGSTLATQIEKYRHSADGRTGSVDEKIRQMLSASLRSYMDGQDTTASRRRIVVDYLNSTPLAGRPGFGEVIGLGDGLWGWYGSDLDTVTRVLTATPSDAEETARRGAVFKQVLSLLLAQRRPSYYLLAGRGDLGVLADRYTRLLHDAGLIDTDLRDATLAAGLPFTKAAPAPAEASFVDRKGVNAIRVHLLSLLGVRSFYELDRLDLTVATTIDAKVQNAVTDVLLRLRDPAEAAGFGVRSANLLARGDPANVVYSVTLYERGKGVNALRVQADNLERPLDISAGSKLDLGSTAKLRTLVTYLSIIAELHDRYERLPPADLRQVATDADDPLTGWAAGYLSRASDRSLQGMLDAAMERRYSASPAQQFFTGRGLHSFANFNRSDNGRIMSLWDAFADSVNLVFIRVMRDIVAYYEAEGPDPTSDVLADRSHPARATYLERFADREGGEYLSRFFTRYRNLSPDDALALLASRSRPVPHRLAVVFRSVRPDADVEAFHAFLRRSLPQASVDDATAAGLFRKYGPDRFSLNDRGYLARVHPLELWLVGYLQRHPGATRQEVLQASVDERQEAYRWLFRSSRKGAVDRRIRMVMEEDTFKLIHRQWQKVGYPFPSLVPSLATALGSSADQPQALSELMGIIVNDGMRVPMSRVERLHFAAGTPYETVVERQRQDGERVLPAEVARTARQALLGVVKNGTARRIHGAFDGADGTPVIVGGKTGTGDELVDSAGLKAVRTSEVSRSGAFVFFIGDRFFGTITAHVAGAHAREYAFTSALPVQVLKALAPALEPLLSQAPSAGATVTVDTKADARLVGLAGGEGAQWKARRKAIR
jgi:membrane peptidoglycan carboxypeptidase